MSKVLVAYFSASGITAKVAAELAKTSGADLFEIKPEVPYTAADLDYRDKQSRSTVEMTDPACRPKFVGKVDNMDAYSTVFVGFPIWWGREPSIVDTFLESYDLAGKTIVPFATSGGSGVDKAAEHIRTVVGSGVKVDGGKLLSVDFSEEDLKIWTGGLV